MKELERYLGKTYIDSCQPDIMTQAPENLPNLEMPTIITYTGVNRTKTYAEMTYIKNNNTDKATRHKPRKKNVHETDMHKI